MSNRPGPDVGSGIRAAPKDLPSIDRMLREPAIAALLAEHGHTLVAREARALLAALRQRALDGHLSLDEVGDHALTDALRARLDDALAPRMTTVLNLSGTVIHTNLGRAVLADSAVSHLVAMMAAPNNLEYDLASGEVGTTNRTHRHDYERAITPQTALLMKVHTSNYAIQGFTHEVDEADLATIAHARGLPLATDLGSGALVDLSLYGLPREPLPKEKIAAGCDVITFSGDKLLGGPQAGLIVGSTEAVERIRRFPMKRALRMSKLPLAALEATLMLYLRPERLARDLPTLRLLTRPLAAIRAMADDLQRAVAQAVEPRFEASVVALQGQIGSGSLPIERLESAGLALAPRDRKMAGRALDELAAALRALPVPVIGRIAEDRLLLDLRCLEDAGLLRTQLPALRRALQ
ncbi:MAG: L-seryl-tRNA(Sec) selenium transferase [Burkholderiaceae bacterium]|nr:L-seryl-tRNA(Sec) selenium transferase [Burkholderiaceae bacterium]